MRTKIAGIIAMIAVILAAAMGALYAPDLTDSQQPNEENYVSVPGPNSSFEVHFIDVGQGDASLIICDGEAMLIDGGEPDQSSKIYAYLKEHGIDRIKYLVASHGHSDHVGGLSAALNYASVETVFCSTTYYATDAFESFLKHLEKRNLSITVPTSGDVYDLGSAKVLIIGPSKTFDNENDNSLVIKVIYGDTSVLFTADAEREAELRMVSEYSSLLKSTVLKVGHHGSDTSSSYLFLREVMPECAVISVGSDNTYGHPHETVLSRLRDAEVNVMRTDLNGSIVMHSDGLSITYSSDRNDAFWEEYLVSGFIGNLNSKKFHRANCSNLPSEKNRIVFEDRQEAIAQGYSPCGNCKP